MEPIKIAHGRDNMAMCKTISLLRGQLEGIKLVIKELEKRGRQFKKMNMILAL